jgi:hypothetical protein
VKHWLEGREALKKMFKKQKQKQKQQQKIKENKYTAHLLESPLVSYNNRIDVYI